MLQIIVLKEVNMSKPYIFLSLSEQFLAIHYFFCSFVTELWIRNQNEYNNTHYYRKRWYRRLWYPGWYPPYQCLGWKSCVCYHLHNSAQEFYDLPLDVVRQQVEAIINDLQPQVVKIGLLRRSDVVEMLVEVLQKYKPRHIIYAPVQTSSRGDRLINPKVFETIERLLIPLCTIVLSSTDLPFSPRRHGQANQLASALAYYLSLGESETIAQNMQGVTAAVRNSTISFLLLWNVTTVITPMWPSMPSNSM